MRARRRRSKPRDCGFGLDASPCAYSPMTSATFEGLMFAARVVPSNQAPPM